MNKYFFMAVVLALAVNLAGCETVKGVGRDITGASSTLQEKMSGSGRDSQRN